MLSRVRRTRQLWRYFGTEWLAYRLAYTARLRLGLIQRSLPVHPWTARPLRTFLVDKALADPKQYLDYRRAGAATFFFNPSDRERFAGHFNAWDTCGKSPIKESDELASGKLTYFAHTVHETGFPQDWHTNPFVGERLPDRPHWSRIGDFDSGDIKAVWEPSRFGFVYPLVRAYWRTGEERYGELFWQAVESWRLHNPPQQGPNWKCGQETSLRVMAWTFGLHAFLGARSSNSNRFANLAQMIAESGERIYANRSYAIHQHNNHGISEGAGLWTIGTLFPEFREAAKWKREGRRMLERQGRELIYEDGAFSQHSVNYQRMMLQVYVWALRLGELNGQPFSCTLRERVGRAAKLLYALQDESTGRLPNYGHNDGSLVLPLDNCDYLDYRPAIQSAHYLTERRRLYGEGPWDEDLLWLFGSEALSAPVNAPPRGDLRARVGGYYTLRSDKGKAFVRCATYKDRPAQADMLHVDLWWRGQNVALDPGTFSYNSPPPMDLALAGTAYHNTVAVDGRDQMERAGRFMWLPWLNARVRADETSAGGLIAYWEGEHDGYAQLSPPVSHRRCVIRLGDEHWLVLDQLESSARHDYRLHWLMQDAPYTWDDTTPCVGRLTLHTPAGPYLLLASSLESQADFSIARAEESSARGWQSVYYLDRKPAISVEACQQSESVFFWSAFGPPPVEVQTANDEIIVEGANWRSVVRLQKGNAALLVRSVDFEGESKEMLLIQEREI